MIFVTVGTHEQQFNRLIKKIDELVKNGVIKEEVIIQSGFSTYRPNYCNYKSLLPYSEMIKKISEARIVISHGGPATFIMPLQVGKVPIVVPRLKKFDEHVNNHQLEFVKIVKERYGNIILIDDIDNLENIIKDYDYIIDSMPKEVMSNNVRFNEELDKIVKQII